jgi:Ca-activated chloride channel homolog
VHIGTFGKTLTTLAGSALVLALFAGVVPGCVGDQGRGTEQPRASRPSPAPTTSPAAAPAQESAKLEPIPPQAAMSAVTGYLQADVERLRAPAAPVDRERYPRFDDNPVYLTLENPVSTFSIDVDTAAYANMRRVLSQGATPNPEAIRTEELINYFDYAYAAPTDRNRPFAVHAELGPSPWHPGRQLLDVGLKGFERDTADRPASNIVFLIDVSGSMASPDKLDLLKAALKLLVPQLRPQDRIAMAVYAGAAGTVLEPTPGDQKARILAALDALSAGGSTNGGDGIELAYHLARQSTIEGGINRVILATDGDFNVGMVDDMALKHLIERERASGVGLTVLGFGTGNYNDALMQELAQAGNGNAAYIDTLNEGRKVLVDELAATLEIIAQDVKIQVEFNPRAVSEYRLIGYETRRLEREDFNNDRVDAGDIGAGHTVTALYELTPTGSKDSQIDPLRYRETAPSPAAASDEIAFVRVRYKLPGTSTSLLIETPVAADSRVERLADTSQEFRFSAAVAAFGQILRGGRYTGKFGYDGVLALARGARGTDPYGYRGEFLGLVSTAAALSGTTLGHEQISNR